jgi:hypothetical protein
MFTKSTASRPENHNAGGGAKRAWQLILGLVIMGGLAVQDAAASSLLGFSTGQTKDFLLIGTGPRSYAYGVDVDNRALRGGDIAITSPTGDIELSNVTHINPGGQGIRTTQSTFSDVTNGISNSTFNGSAYSSSNGITLNYSFNTLNQDLADARTWINGLTATQTRETNYVGSNALTSIFTINLQSGLNVIDLGMAGSDFSISNATLRIDGPEDAVAIFRVVNGKSFLTSNAIIDNNTGKHDNVMFYSDSSKTQAFNLSNMLNYGGNEPMPHPQDIPGILSVSFWALGTEAEININNAIGCTQLVAYKINLNDVDFGLCAFDPGNGGDIPPVIPLPMAVWGGMVLLGGIGSARWLRGSGQQA